MSKAVYSPQNIPAIASAFQSTGMNPTQVAGAIGNIRGESVFDPRAILGGDTTNLSTVAQQIGVDPSASYGLMQWNSTRYDALIRFSNDRGDYSYLPGNGGNGTPSLETQTAFIASKENGTATSTYNNYINDPASSRDPTSASDLFAKKVEGTVSGYDLRRAAAEEYAAKGTVTGGGGGSSTPAIPPNLKAEGYTAVETSEAGTTIYTKPDGSYTEFDPGTNKYYQYGPDTKLSDGTVVANPYVNNEPVYNTDGTTKTNPITGQPFTKDEIAQIDQNGSLTGNNSNGDQVTVNQSSQNSAVPPEGVGGNTVGAGGAGAGLGGAGAAAAGGMNIGGAGCVGGGLSAAGLGAAGGLMGQLGGIAQNAAMAGALSVLSGGGIQGALGAVLGSAGGALGNALGAAAGSAAGFAAGSIGATISSGIGQALGGALGGIIAGQNPLQALTGAAFGALSQMGGALMPGLSGVMPPEIAAGAMQGLQAGLGALAKGAPPSAAFQMALAGGLGGTLSSYVNNMTGNFALGATLGAAATGALNGTLSGFSQNAQVSGQINLLQFASNISTVSAVASGNRLMVGAVTEAMATGFGSSTTGGLGAKTRNMQDAMTFSITTLGQNLGPVAADFQDLGAWDATNLMRFMQPGHVAAQILIAGLGDYTGLQTALVNAGVPLAGVDNPMFDRLTQTALSGINDPEICNTVRAAFAMIREFDNLGELTSLQKMMPNSYNTMPVNNFRELGIQLSIIGVSGSVGQALTCRIIGDAIAKIEVSTDLNHIQQLNDPLPPEVGNKLLDIYGYGGGSLGEQTMADFIGTAAGYVHTDTIPVIVKTSDAIGAHVSATRYVALLELLKDALGGKYTTLDVAGDPNASPPIPDQAGYISIPFPAPTFENVVYNSLDEVIFAFVPLLEAELQKIIDASATDPALANNIKQLSTAWNASCAQIVREANNLKIHNIDLFNTMPASPQMGMMFTQMLDYWGLQTGYGQAGHYIERVASNDFYGDCVKYCMRQARNANALEGLGIDTEQYKLPQSKFLRDPEGFYQELYTGNLPATPSNRKAMSFPHDLNSVYIEGREKMLREMGYGDTPLQNNQKDELYYDAHWVEVNTNILEDMGRNAVKTMLDRNILVSGNDLLIVDLDGNTTKFASIEDNGLLLTDNEMLVSTMLEIVNKLLYGNIQTTKYTNPFNTDQMVYGVLELLAQVTNQNVEALMQTITGGLIANGLLEKIMTQFQTSRSLYDTRMNRNDPSAYGGVGSNTVKIN